ncbi:CG31076 [Drosophila busckii]|uniref:CG31076 n=1 Tax=Drosophila busckii TaxID=30019 RepID=A0A0M3QXA8_DROBS|nr:leucine-rich melanocyte differentiation-associated protein [Drosophila busckii]ALC45603.1 CG31076 [Drosophila busckii]
METLHNETNNDCQLIVVQQNLRTLPASMLKQYADYVEYMDLSNNCLKDLAWLAEFEQLRYLVLDNNCLQESQLRTLVKPLPQLEVLMLNKNEFSDLPTTVKLLRRLFPNLQYLSLHGNPICPDGLNLKPFSNYLQYDYKYYSNFIAQSFSHLKFLDHGLVQRSYSYETFPNNIYAKTDSKIKTTKV